MQKSLILGKNTDFYNFQNLVVDIYGARCTYIGAYFLKNFYTSVFTF